jgi:hypothetical protein
MELAKQMMQFAFNDPRFKARARTSIYHVSLLWPKIARTYKQDQLKANQEGKNNAQQCSAAA